MTQANVRDLAFLEKPVTDNVPGSVRLSASKQTDRRVDVREIMPRLGDLRLISGDGAADLGTLLLQGLDDERFFHVAKN